VSKVLDAAALTYVAALVTTVMELVYFLIRMQGNRR
jgi:Zn-dependent membrane protease YugP